jgi:holo-[acyl-carrier protein] synthase
LIIGIGIDSIRTERMERIIVLHGERFINRIFTSGEQAYCSGKTMKYESYAVRFSAKEAMFKALGRGWGECGFTGVEVVSDWRGKPGILLHGCTKIIAEELGVNRIFLSLTHDKWISSAVVILER